MAVRIDRSQVGAVEAFDLDSSLERSAQRRARNVAEKRCINENKRRSHGLATHGERCFRCYLVNKHGAVVAHSMPEYKAAQPVFVLGEEGSSHGAAGPVRSAAAPSGVTS